MKANDLLREFTGTENYYAYLMGHKLTDGSKYAADIFQCYWFLDIIVSYQHLAKVRAEEFQTWELKRIAGDEFLVRATDGNNNTLVKQEVSFSDFPHDEFTLYLVDKVILLPCEY